MKDLDGYREYKAGRLSLIIQPRNYSDRWFRTYAGDFYLPLFPHVALRWERHGHLVFDGSCANLLPGLCQCDRDLEGAGAHFVDPEQHFFRALSIERHGQKETA